MSNIIIYHNPRCSKSRQTLALLKERGINPVIIEYLKNPLTEDEIKDLLVKLDLPAQDLMRQKETLFKTLELKNQDDETLIKAMAVHPALIERPVVVSGEKAVIGRPPEQVHALLETV